MKRLLFLIALVSAVAAGILIWVSYHRQRRNAAVLASAADSQRLALLAASVVLGNANVTNRLIAPGAVFQDTPLTQVAVPVVLLANVENTVAFAWNGRKLYGWQFVRSTGEELEVDMTKTDEGFTTVVNEAMTGTVYLFLFNA